MIYLYLVLSTIILFLTGVRIVRPTHRGLIERFGKYHHFANPGFHWNIPIIDRLFLVNITEQMVEIKSQDIITNDNINVKIGTHISVKVKSDEDSVKESIYNVNDYMDQIIKLSRSILRNIIGTLTLESANLHRYKIITEISSTLNKEIKRWGIELVRIDLNEIEPSKDIQEAITKVVSAKIEKTAATESAKAAELRASGIKILKIEKAEGYKQSRILHAEGEATAIKLVSEAADKYFVGNAQLLRRLEAFEVSLSKNARTVIPSDKE